MMLSPVRKPYKCWVGQGLSSHSQANIHIHTNLAAMGLSAYVWLNPQFVLSMNEERSADQQTLLPQFFRLLNILIETIGTRN